MQFIILICGSNNAENKSKIVTTKQFLKTQFMLKVYNNEKYEDEKKQMNTIFMT